MRLARSPSDPRADAAALRARAAVLGGLLAVSALLYAGVFGWLYDIAPNTEQVFAEPGSSPPLTIYLTTIDIDPVREELQVHLDFATIEGPRGQHYPGVPTRDLIVQVGDGGSVHDIALQGGRSAPPVSLLVSLRGLVGDYPLDTYHGRMSFTATEVVGGARQPVRLTVWPVMSRWTVGVARADPPPPIPAGIDLDITVVRPAPFIVIAVAIYGAMALVGLSALTTGALVFLGIRQIESTLTGALAAMVFAVPVLRGALPGVPPLGGHGDVLVFVWVELAVIIGLTLFVIAWARRGPVP